MQIIGRQALPSCARAIHMYSVYSLSQRAASASARSASSTMSSSTAPLLDLNVHGNGDGRVMSPLVKSSLDGMMGFPSAPVAGTMSNAHSRLISGG